MMSTLGLLLSMAPAAAADQVAFVVGNVEYANAPRLDGAIDDANRVAQTLEGLGYQVIVQKNASLDAIKSGLRSFRSALRSAKVGFLYYAGHVVQLEGENYIVPVDAELAYADDARDESYKVRWAMNKMAEGGAELNVVVLDAARSHPWAEGDGATRGLEQRGLARASTPSGQHFLLAYPTDPDRTVAQPGLYAKVLAEQIVRPCATLPEIFAKVTDAVVFATGAGQRPWLDNGAGKRSFAYVPAGCDEAIAAASSAVADAAAIGRPEPVEDRPIEAPTMVPVPGGTFTMGFSDAVGATESDAAPGHTVTVSGFAISKSEVTQDLWTAVMGSNPSVHTSCGPQCPVDGVTWLDAARFANQLSERLGLTPAYTIVGGDVTWDRGADGYRLPTEAEWEYAATRGVPHQGFLATGEARRTGGGLYAEVGWIGRNDEGFARRVAEFRDRAPTGPGFETHPVCNKPATPPGLCDVIGNVCEWVWDWHGRYRRRAVTDPIGPSKGEARVLRGGDVLVRLRDISPRFRYGLRLSGCQNNGVRLARNVR